MRGEDVRALQQALQSPQRPDFAGADFLQSVVDGVFGEHTHRAVYRGKYWLGYTKPDHRARDSLVAYLDGTREPTPTMAENRRKRLGALKKQPRGVKKVREAIKHLGVAEDPPGTNKVLFSAWYGFVGPWCAMFIAYCGCEAGIKAYARRRRWAYVPAMVEDARFGRFHYALTHELVTGDDVAFDWPPNDGVADHIGIYVSEPDLEKISPTTLNAARQQFGPLGPGDFWSIEGNTAVGADSSGGCVLIRKRNRRSTYAYMHPGG